MIFFTFKVTGIEGTFRKTCESVMTVLRNNKDTLMAVLEAFVYDPLLSWRLMETSVSAQKTPASTTNVVVTETNSVVMVSAANIAMDTVSAATSYAASLSRKVAFNNVGDPGKWSRLYIVAHVKLKFCRKLISSTRPYIFL